MSKIYKYSFIVYRAFLLALIPLFLVGRFLVGAAGHTPQSTTEDYFVFGLVALTSFLMLVYINTISHKNTIRICIMIINVLSILFLLYTLIGIWKFYQNHENQSGEEIPLTIMFFLIVLNSIIFYGLLKNKIQTKSK
ncbi:hypothetical protein ACFFLS_06310 [Flavobacterium procerum]|uniref:DUF4293 family protein n=1 Tax=Flavobacterium procerum TaxID=1455569 RepID=A0ABV6BMG4_9FLAO